jgi:hypothetical protein
MFFLAKPLFPNANIAMGTGMMKDMTFDATPAIRDFGWSPRDFHPLFDQGVGTFMGRRLRASGCQAPMPQSEQEDIPVARRRRSRVWRNLAA